MLVLYVSCLDVFLGGVGGFIFEVLFSVLYISLFLFFGWDFWSIDCLVVFFIGSGGCFCVFRVLYILLILFGVELKSFLIIDFGDLIDVWLLKFFLRGGNIGELWFSVLYVFLGVDVVGGRIFFWGEDKVLYIFLFFWILVCGIECKVFSIIL